MRDATKEEKSLAKKVIDLQYTQDLAEFRDRCIEFIKNDLTKREETITSKKIIFIGVVFFLNAKKKGFKRGRQVVYSAADNVLPGYRPIHLKYV